MRCDGCGKQIEEITLKTVLEMLGMVVFGAILVIAFNGAEALFR